MPKRKILVSGGTGFVGKFTVPFLREHFEVDVISRKPGSEVQGDLTLWNGGLDLESLKKKNYDVFLHMAGLYDLEANEVDCNQHNVNALGVALKVASELNVKTFVNTSTVAAAINSPLRLVKPYDLQLTKSFPDAYSLSKANGEELLKNWNGSFKKINLRLGVLIGDSQIGKIDRLDGPYAAIQAFRKLKKVLEKFPTALPLPGKEQSRLPLVPVDMAAFAITQFCLWGLKEELQDYKSFHITPEQGASVKEVYEWILKGLDISHKGIYLVDVLGESLLIKLTHSLAGLPKEQLYYMLNFPNYDSSETEEVLGKNWCPEFSKYQETLWSGYEAFISNRRD